MFQPLLGDDELTESNAFPAANVITGRPDPDSEGSEAGHGGEVGSEQRAGRTGAFDCAELCFLDAHERPIR